MSRSCIIKEFPVPEREYRVSTPERWDRNQRPAPPRRGRRQRGGTRLAPLLLAAGLALFGGGFLLGQAAAADPLPAAQGSAAGALAESGTSSGGDTPVKILGSIGDVFFGGEGGTAPEPEEPEALAPDGASDWNLVLINGENPLPESFAVPELTALKNGHAIDSRVYPALQAMMDGARAAGYQPLICSSFRSWDKQEELFEKKVAACLPQAGSREAAEAQAAVWVARPGTSEHQAGLAVDIVDKEYQLLDQAQEDRPVQRWLMEHCAEYGFILRYPTAKSELTGVGYEPWHYRYVGKEAAEAIMAAGICLEEYSRRS